MGGEDVEIARGAHQVQARADVGQAGHHGGEAGGKIVAVGGGDEGAQEEDAHVQEEKHQHAAQGVLVHGLFVYF